jgi:hypothetical protein
VLIKLEYLVYQPRSGWTRPRFDLLHGAAATLGEIILKKVGGVQTRLIGFFDEARGIFNIVLVVKKKSKQYDPKDWIESALSRAKEIKANPERANDWHP